jgi:glutamine amidotransferase
MLCVVPPNVIPSREKLENSALNNPHGFGFAIVIPKENRIHVERTMNADTSINRFIEMRGKYPEGYAMWHARFATHGTTTVDNCHPFKVGKDERTYLAHNGILPIIEPQGDTRSDTRIFAEDLLPAIGGVASLDNEQVVNLLDDFTTGSKVCVLTIHPDAKYQCYLFHKEKGWEDDSGVWWSNDSCYLPKPYAYTASSWENKYYSTKPLDFITKHDKDIKFYDCKVCEFSVAEDELWDSGLGDDYCPQCGCCYQCNTYMSDDLCYKGSNADAKWWSKQGGWDW